MSEDREVELWKRQKLLEMQRRALAKQQASDAPSKPLDPREVLKDVFVGRAWEVYDAARRQYPAVAERLLREVATLVQVGRIQGTVTGEQLFWLFRSIGLDVRLETQIRVRERGELKSLAEKLKSA